MDRHSSSDHLLARALSRRRLFELGGAGVALATVLAACGKSDAPEPGRVGNAPSTTLVPALPIGNAVYLRTMSSIEYTIIDVYDQLSTIDSLDEATAAAITRFTDDHQAAADHLSELVSAAGGQPYECANPWWMIRLVQPSLDHIFGAGDIPPSDDPARDAASFVDVLEKVSAASYQQLVEKLSEPELRGEVIALGCSAARRSATMAVITNGVPGGLVSPALAGGVVEKDEAGFTPTFAIESRFGQLVPFELQVGTPNELGVRFKVNYETPSDNSYIYEGMTCPDTPPVVSTPATAPT